MVINPYKLDMYLCEQTRVLFADLQNAVCADIDFITKFPIKARHRIYFGQICGIDFANSAADEFRYLATFSLCDPALPSGYYRSVLITPAQTGLPSLAAFKFGTHEVAINDPESFSGAITFASKVLGSGQMDFTYCLFTGSHVESVFSIAGQEAMLASIDCVSFTMIMNQYPEIRQHIRVLGYTDAFPGLPFVTSAQMPDDICELMTERLVSFLEGERLRTWQDKLGVSGIVRLPSQQYQKMKNV